MVLWGFFYCESTKRDLLLSQVIIDAARGLRRDELIYPAALRLFQDSSFSLLKNLERIRKINHNIAYGFILSLIDSSMFFSSSDVM